MIHIQKKIFGLVATLSSLIPSSLVAQAPTTLDAAKEMCANNRILLPELFPDFESCKRSEPVGCNGWVPATDKLEGSDELYTQPTEPTTLFTWASDSTLCLYLQRNELAFGIHCYNVNTCAVCAFDSSDPPSTGFANMKWIGIENCSKCHVPGPILPTKKIWDQTHTSTQVLSRRCAERGGPQWLLQDAWRKPNTTTMRVNPTPSCRGCHAFFAKTESSDYCGIVDATLFEQYGSMKQFNPNFAGEECRQFGERINCSLNCPE